MAYRSESVPEEAHDACMEMMKHCSENGVRATVFFYKDDSISLAANDKMHDAIVAMGEFMDRFNDPIFMEEMEVCAEASAKTGGRPFHQIQYREAQAILDSTETSAFLASLNFSSEGEAEDKT